jgi:hypothetical protein
LTGDGDQGFRGAHPVPLVAHTPAHFDSPCFPTMSPTTCTCHPCCPAIFSLSHPPPRTQGKKTQADRHRERCIERTIKLASSRPGRSHPTSFFIVFPKTVPLLLSFDWDSTTKRHLLPARHSRCCSGLSRHSYRTPTQSCALRALYQGFLPHGSTRMTRPSLARCPVPTRPNDYSRRSRTAPSIEPPRPRQAVNVDDRGAARPDAIRNPSMTRPGIP